MKRIQSSHKNLVFLFLTLSAVGAIIFSFKMPVKGENSISTKRPFQIEKEELKWLDFESGYAKAAKEKKILLVDVYTDWCGWCKVMDKNTYSNDTIIQLINEKFVPVKLNPEKNRTYNFGDKTMSASDLHKWLGYGQTFGYPTTYFMVHPGISEERYAQAGYLDAKAFGEILNIVINKN